MDKVKKLDRMYIRATDLIPWPSTWVLWDPHTKKYLKTVGGGQSLKMSWCEKVEDALHLNGNDAMYLGPLVGDIDSPMHIVQCPEDD